MATFMTNSPTGALQPPACRFRNIANAGGAIPFVSLAANAAFVRIVAIHETSSNVHFTAEPQPLNIPSGIELTTADGPSFNPSHYTIDLGTGGGATPRVTLAHASSLSGFTLGGVAASAGSALLGFGVGSATGTSTATAHHVALVGTGAGSGQTGILVTANGTLTSDLVTINGVDIGVNVDYPGTGTTLTTFAGTALMGTVGLLGVNVADASSRVTLGGSTFTVNTAAGAGIQVLGGQATVGTSGFVVNGAGGGGLLINAGQATLTATTLSLTSVTGTSRGISVLGTGTPSVSMTGGSVTMTASSALPATGVDVLNAGTATLAGVTVTTNANTHGVRAQNTAAVTINGASVITNSCVNAAAGCSLTGATIVGSTTGSGILVPAGVGNVGVVVNVAGTTQVTKYLRGIESNDGSLAVTGTVQVTGNTDDGIRSWGLNDTTTTTVSITGATLNGNGDQGLSVNTVIPTTIQMSTINSNVADGIAVQSSQDTAQAGYRFLSLTNTIRLNGGRGIYVSSDSGRSGVRIENNTIAANVLEGVRISELAGGVLNVTEALIVGNTVNGNLTSAATVPADILAGGIFFTQLTSPIPLAAGVSGPGVDRILLGSFLGNRVFGNGRHEIGFDLTQEGGGAWDLSSNSAAVDMALVCSDTARPNYVYCYDTVPGEDLGVAIPAASGILVKAKGVHFQNQPPIAGRDYSVGIAAPTVLSPEPTNGVFLSCAAQTGCI